ncbi:MAG: MTAP family purine nucleoside phosphorylase [Solirubrobacterales bacterium]
MARLGIAGGNATEGIDLGGVEWTAIDRHGERGYTLPHLIDHQANMRRLAEAGCDRVLGIASVGGLQPQYGPGTFLSPDDFISLQAPLTTLEGREAHQVIGFDADWRARVIEEWAGQAEPPLVDGGVYWQALGPRLETPAEVRLAARDADVIGMTIASECVVAAELGLSYAAVCVVVNYANGVGDAKLTIGELERGQAANRDQLARVLDALIPALA